MTPIFRLGVVRIGTTSDFGEIRPLGCSRSKTLFEVEVTKTSSSPSVTSLLEHSRVSVQGVAGHFACLCREFDFYEVKKILLLFKKKREILLNF